MKRWKTERRSRGRRGKVYMNNKSFLILRNHVTPVFLISSVDRPDVVKVYTVIHKRNSVRNTNKDEDKFDNDREKKKRGRTERRSRGKITAGSGHHEFFVCCLLETRRIG